MIKILEILSGFYWVLIPQFIIESLLRTKWRTAYKSHGPMGVITEGFGSAIGLNSMVFYVDIYSPWNGHSIKRLLAKYGVPVWGWGYAFDQFYFRVPIEDADFAQSIMLETGIELLGT